jgi:hypothetical protein
MKIFYYLFYFGFWPILHYDFLELYIYLSFVLIFNYKKVVSSDQAGRGKSTFIENQPRIGNLPLSRVSINSEITYSELIELLKIQGNSNYHLNIASTATTSLNLQLYELLFLGWLLDESGEIFRTPIHSFFYIELPVLLEKNQERNLQRNFDRFFFLQFLTFLKVDSISHPLDVNDFQVQFVCKILYCKRSNPQLWNSMESISECVNQPNLSVQQCLQVLQQFLPNWIINESSYISLMR